MSTLPIEPSAVELLLIEDDAFRAAEANGGHGLTAGRLALFQAGVAAERSRATDALAPQQALLAADVIENPGANWDPAYVRKVVVALKQIAGGS